MDRKGGDGSYLYIDQFKESFRKSIGIRPKLDVEGCPTADNQYMQTDMCTSAQSGSFTTKLH